MKQFEASFSSSYFINLYYGEINNAISFGKLLLIGNLKFFNQEVYLNDITFRLDSDIILKQTEIKNFIHFYFIWITKTVL